MRQDLRGLLYAIILLLCGCVGTKPVILDTTPQGADIYIDDNLIGRAPVTYVAKWRKPGYESFTVEAKLTGYANSRQVILGAVPFISYHDRYMIKMNPLSAAIPVDTASAPHNKHQQDKYGDPGATVIKDFGVSRWAVVVGLSRYATQSGGLENLPFAADDARMFSDALVKSGWSLDHVKCLTDDQATKRNVEVALESWLTKAGHDDLIVLYWAGHGFPDPDDPEKVYFACHDTDVQIPATGFRMDRIRNSLEERKTRNVVVLADTCHAGKLVTRGERGMSVLPEIQRMNERNNVPKGWVFMVSADTDRKAVEHSAWRNGAFTHCLLKGLDGAADGFQSVGAQDGTVTLGELRAYLTTAMPDETQKVLGVAKHPLITTSSGDPSIWNLTLQP